MGLLIAAVIFFGFYFFVGFKIERTSQYRNSNWMWFVVLGFFWLFLNSILGALQGEWWIVHPDWTKNSSVLWWVSLTGGIIGLIVGDRSRK